MSAVQPDSLVKYGTAILVSTSIAGKKLQQQQKGKTAPTLTSTMRNEDFLNSILPPREYTENN